jgi:hypothetical protein
MIGPGEGHIATRSLGWSRMPKRPGGPATSICAPGARRLRRPHRDRPHGRHDHAGRFRDSGRRSRRDIRSRAAGTVDRRCAEGDSRSGWLPITDRGGHAGLPYDRPAVRCGTISGAERGPASQARSTSRMGLPRTWPIDHDITPTRPPRSSPRCCTLPASGVRDDLLMADERPCRASSPHRRSAPAGTGSVAGVPIAPLPRRRGGRRVRGQPGAQACRYSPNYQRLLERGDASDVGDILAAGRYRRAVAKLRRRRSHRPRVSFSPRSDRDARIESRGGPGAFLASLCPSLDDRSGLRRRPSGGPRAARLHGHDRNVVGRSPSRGHAS